MSSKQTEFTQFYQASRKNCPRAVPAAAGRPQLAEDHMAEAFTRTWLPWRTASRHPAPHARVVPTALNTGVWWWRRPGREPPPG